MGIPSNSKSGVKMKQYLLSSLACVGLMTSSVLFAYSNDDRHAMADCVAQYTVDVCQMRCEHSEDINCHSDCQGEEAEHICHQEILKDRESGTLPSWHY